MRSVFVAISLAIVPPIALAQAPSAAVIGRIELIEADRRLLDTEVYIRRSDTTVAPLRKGRTLLYANDRIYVRVARVKVSYSMVGSTKFREVTQLENNGDLLPVGAGRPDFCSLVACAKIAHLLDRPWTPIAKRTLARRDDTQPQPVQSAPFLAAANQKIPMGTSRLAVVWAGGTGVLLVDQKPAQLVSEPGGEFGYEVFKEPRGLNFNLTVRGESGGTVGWSVEKVTTPIPGPPGMPAAIASDADRLARALWLLGSGKGHESWRLFAISEIAALKDVYYPADLCWRLLVAQEWKELGLS